MAINVEPTVDFATLVPVVETALFGDKPDARFWVGKVASMGVVSMPLEYLASRQLRANVYIDEMGFLPENARQQDGGESDIDDERSVQFAVIENRTEDTQLAVGTTRLIVKRHKDDLLPIERLFPESFMEAPATVGTTEASRFIARHPNNMQQHIISLAGIRAMDLHSFQEDIPYVYAVVEKPLANLFRMINLPFTQISELKMIEEYNTPNMAVKIDPKEVFKSVDRDLSGKLILTQFFNNALESLGLGYFDESLQNKV